MAVLVFGGGDGESQAADPAADRAAAVQDEAERLRREAAARDKEQIEQLTERARAMTEDFAPVAAGMGRTLPPGKDRIGPLANAGEVAEWRRQVQDANEFFEHSVSGETATNVARNGLSNAVDALLEAVRTYELALDAPSVRTALLERAREQRDLAARTWSTAAIQIDVINIDAGFGHQHVVFPSSTGAGAVPPDSLPEGTDAEPPGDR
ncbi:MAG: hypothetical protein ACRDPC_07090 [Solirubrobacteraceae bacterium]